MAEKMIVVSNTSSRKRKSSDIFEESESSSSPHSDPSFREACPQVKTSSGDDQAKIISTPTEVETCTSKWTKNTLNKLAIISVTTKAFCPMVLIQLAFNVKDPNIKKRVERCKEKIVEHDVLGVDKQNNVLDVNDIEDLDSQTALNWMLVHFKNRWHHNIGLWHVHPPHNDDVLEKRIFQKFRVHGELFAQNLINMTYIKKNPDHDLTEYMFQNLFQEFAAQFGLISLSYPFIAASQIDVGKIVVSSAPDMIFPDFTSSSKDDDNLKLLAVCKVKKKYKTKEECCTDEEIKTRAGTVKEPTIWHLEDDLQGQVGGELLVHFPHSQNNGLLGIIVQRTNVTFFYFQCNSVQFDEIQTGNHCVNEPVIYYSRPYNYLKAADREELIEPLLTLGFIQYSPCCIDSKEHMESVY